MARVRLYVFVWKKRESKRSRRNRRKSKKQRFIKIRIFPVDDRNRKGKRIAELRKRVVKTGWRPLSLPVSIIRSLGQASNGTFQLRIRCKRCNRKVQYILPEDKDKCEKRRLKAAMAGRSGGKRGGGRGDRRKKGGGGKRRRSETEDKCFYSNNRPFIVIEANPGGRPQLGGNFGRRSRRSLSAVPSSLPAAGAEAAGADLLLRGTSSSPRPSFSMAASATSSSSSSSSPSTSSAVSSSSSSAQRRSPTLAISPLLPLSTAGWTRGAAGRSRLLRDGASIAPPLPSSSASSFRSKSSSRTPADSSSSSSSSSSSLLPTVISGLAGLGRLGQNGSAASSASFAGGRFRRYLSRHRRSIFNSLVSLSSSSSPSLAPSSSTSSSLSSTASTSSAAAAAAADSSSSSSSSSSLSPSSYQQPAPSRTCNGGSGRQSDCCLVSIPVDPSEFGMGDSIVAPSTLFATSCDGSCQAPRGGQRQHHPHHHQQQQQQHNNQRRRHRRRGRGGAGGGRGGGGGGGGRGGSGGGGGRRRRVRGGRHWTCEPVETQPLDVWFFDRNHQLAHARLPDFVISKCGCRRH